MVKRLAGQGLKDQSGAVAALFAVSLPVIAMFVGAGVDYGNAQQMKAKLQNATDSAVLGATASTNLWDFYFYHDDVAANVTKAVTANFTSQTGLEAQVDTTVDNATGTITTTTTAQVPTYLGAFFGRSTIEIGARAQAKRGASNMEIALVLDTTGSMTGTKIAALRNAAINLLWTVYLIPNGWSRMKMSVVPFAQYVNIGTTYRGAAWLSGTEDVTTSGVNSGISYPNAQYLDPYTVSRTCYNDGIPYDCSYTAYGTVNLGTGVPYSNPYTYTARWRGCVGSRNYPLDLGDAVDSTAKVPGFLDTDCASPMQRLTSDWWDIYDKIVTMTVGGETYIPAGLLWGWRSLSSRPPFADGSSNPDVKKFMVVMTDGQNTLTPSYPYHVGGTATTANALTAQTCQNIKNDGISIFTVALSVTDPDIKAILRNCASTPTQFYDAADTLALASSFQQIGTQLTAVRLTQ